MSLRGFRYRIERVFDEYTHDHVAEAPTIDEAHAWILRRIKLAGKTGLRLRPSDFEVVDTWEEQHYSLASCAELVLGAAGAPDYRERYASLPYATPIDGSAPACILETPTGYKTARELLAERTRDALNGPGGYEDMLP